MDGDPNLDDFLCLGPNPIDLCGTQHAPRPV